MKKKKPFSRRWDFGILLCIVICLVLLPFGMLNASPAFAAAGGTDTSGADTSGADTSGGDTSGADTGGDYYPEEDYYEPPPVRVENELNQENISSDTMLWPSDSRYEFGGVSTTTLSIREVDALLELAKKHAGDTDDLEGDGLKEAIIVIENNSSYSNNHAYNLKIPEKQYEKLAAEDWDRLTMQTPIGDFSISPEIMGLTQQTMDEDGVYSGYVQMSVEKLEHDGRPGLDLTLKAGDDTLSEFDTTPYGIRIFIPYTPAEGEDVNALLVEYLPEIGEKVIIRECTYDAELGGLVLYVSHLSKFGVAYRPSAFADVGPDHWANPYVTFLAARGIISGDGGALYRPDDAATRAEFAALTAKAFSAANLPSEPVQLYDDVPTSSYLANISNWLYYNNLDRGITTGNRFRPNELITRQDVATLLNNVINGMGVRVRSQGLDTEYTDSDQIAPYAKEAVERLRAAGVLEMAANYKFNPTATVNRGEIAQIVSTLLSIM